MKLTEAEKRVDEVIAQQRAKGREHYGKGLEHADGHDWNAEALQEVVDAVQYLSAENVRLREMLKKAEAWAMWQMPWLNHHPNSPHGSDLCACDDGDGYVPEEKPEHHMEQCKRFRAIVYGIRDALNPKGAP